MTMLYLLLSLLASQLFLVSPSVIGKEQVENREEPSPSSVVNRTASESDGPNTPPYLLKIYQNAIIKGHKVRGEAPSLQSFQAKCKLNNFIALIVSVVICRKIGFNLKKGGLFGVMVNCRLSVGSFSRTAAGNRA